MQKVQRAFSSGEISPSLFGRVDTARYQTSLRTCRNFMVLLDGGVDNRPGTKFIVEMKDSTVAGRLIKFVFNEIVTNTYLIEMGDYYIRFYQNGARINVAGVAAWADATAYTVGDLVSFGGVNYYAKQAHTSATGTNKPGTDAGAATVWYALTGTIYEIPTPYPTADLPDIQFYQSGNTMRLVHKNHAPRELTRTSDTRWALSTITHGPTIAAPTGVNVTGGAAGTIRYWAVTAVRDGTFEESLAGLFSSINRVPSEANPASVSWNTVPNAISYNVYRSDDGKTYGLIHGSGGSLTDRTDGTWGDDTETATSAVQGVWSAAAGQVRNALEAVSATQRAYDGRYTLKFQTVLSSGAATTGITHGRVALYYQRSTDAARVFFGYINVDPLNGANQTSTNGWEQVIEVPDNGYTTLQFDIVPEVRPGGGGSNCTMNVNTLNAPYTSITWKENSIAFQDIGDDPDLSIGPPTQQNVLNSVGAYPGVVTIYQQRAIYASSTNEPEKVWASKVGGERKNFAFATPLQPDDPVIFQASGRQSNAIKHLLDLTRLVIFTSVSELVAEGNADGILQPDAINLRTHSYNGANRLSPITVNNRALYVQARSNSVRSLRYNDQEGSININLSLFATHLFRNKTIVDWDYAYMPNSIVWAVRSDGTLLGLTYIPEFDVWGWHRHDTDGVVENVCVVPENNDDAVYLIVRRTINGNTKRYIERMAPRYYDDASDAWFVDCGMKYEGGAINTMNGLAHLEGKNVSIFADGATRANPNDPTLAVRTVAGGSVALGGNYTEVLVGLPIIADLETLDIDTTDGGTLKHGKMLVSRVVAFVNNTRRLFIGLPDKPTVPLPLNGLQPFATNLDPNDDTTTRVGARHTIPTSNWNSHGRVLVRHVDPEPASVLMLSPQTNDQED